MVTFVNADTASLTVGNQTWRSESRSKMFSSVREDRDRRMDSKILSATPFGQAQTLGLENHTLLISKTGITFVVDDSAN